MSHQYFYETVQRQEQFHSHWISLYQKESAGNLHCLYCLDHKGDKDVCCDKSEFVPFSELPEYAQAIIADEEYVKVFGK